MSTSSSQTGYTALVAGATGLVGQALVKQLILDQDCQRIYVLARRPSAFKHDKIEYVPANFDALHQLELPDNSTESAHGAAQVDYAFCCLGTTIKTAGSQSAFEKVDYYYVLAFAQLAKRVGARHFGVISSVGADKPVGFYLTTKARMEAAVKDVGFYSLAVYRPSLLMGERTEFRLAEKLGEIIITPLSVLFAGRLSKFKPVPDTQLAKAMIQQSKKNDKGMITLNSKDILR